MTASKGLELANKQRDLAKKLNEYSKQLKVLQDHNQLEESDLEKAKQLDELIIKIESIEVRLFTSDDKNKKAIQDLKKTIEESQDCLNDINHEDIKKLINDSEQLFLDTSKLVEDIADIVN